MIAKETVPRRVAGSVAELVGGSDREPMKTADSLSGSALEWVTVDGARCLIMYLCVEVDPALLGVAAWTTRMSRLG